MSKTILITGSTDGIGLLTAQKLAEKGHTLILHGRSDEKLAKAAKAVGGAPKTYRADLSKPDDVTGMARAVRDDQAQLDVLINNAGILKTPHTKTEAGRDIRFEVNTIAPYVLALSLLPIIPKDGRIVNLSSAAQAPVDVSAMTSYRRMADMDAYAQSKLAITVWSSSLARKLPDGPAVIAVNPGSLLASKMVKEGFGINGNDLNVGADILLRLALDPQFADASGRYFDNDAGRFGAPDPSASNPAHVEAIMKALAEISGLS
ncbi:MAG: SDR family NAD(P)-dependent oxidoreductase [Pseudomonadota bacterium]